MSAAAWSHAAYRYRYGYNAISDLGVPSCGDLASHPVCSPLRAVMNTAFITHGILFALAAIPLAPLLPQRPGCQVRILGIVTGVGLLLVGTFPGSPESVADGTIALHTSGAALAIFGGNFAARTAGVALRRQAHRRLGTALVSLGTAETVSVMVMFAWAAIVASSGVITGVAVAEPASVYTITAAELLVGIAVLAAIRHQARLSADTLVDSPITGASNTRT
ncbi:hypothetical protein [Streptomyces osmaniensis]|uniref:DUF998 domain-containing protein n=1 Tax=Streptomyces osmaniensis TaxID=593134 RepID=A0ABP6YRU9_9ACTN|nr:hypothetical protein KJK32_04960 [Streptomyces sp. JCM17656]